MEDLTKSIRELLYSIGQKEGTDSSENECGCVEDSSISTYALQDEDSLAETITFVICGHKIPNNEEVDPKKFNYDLSKNEVKSIESVWANKSELHNGIHGIINNFENKDLDFNLFRFILSSIPKIGYSKAGLLTQMLMGYLGCYDHEGSTEDGADVSSKAYNNFMRMMRDNPNNEQYKKIWKNWSDVISNMYLSESDKKADAGLKVETDPVGNTHIGKDKFWLVENNGMVRHDD